MSEVFNDRPPPDVIGWCHHCMTFQRGSDARFKDLWWDRGTYAWVCVECDGEPWGWGVWDFNDYEDEHGNVTHEPRWGEEFAACADARCSSYPGDCAEHRTLPVTGDPPG